MRGGVINHRLSKKKYQEKNLPPPTPPQQINKNKQIETKNLYNQL